MKNEDDIDPLQVRLDNIITAMQAENPALVIASLRRTNAEWERRYTALIEATQRASALQDTIFDLKHSVADAVVDKIRNTLIELAARLGYDVNFVGHLRDNIMDSDISCLDLNTRSQHALRNQKINTVRELCSQRDANLLEISNFGKGSLEDVKNKLAAHGLKLS